MPSNSVRCSAQIISPCFRATTQLMVFFILISAAYMMGCADQTDYSQADASGTASESAALLRITSPNHPATFDAGANDKLSQTLEWNRKTQILFAKVTYSQVSGGVDVEVDPSNYKTFSLPFPTVALDGQNNLVVSNGYHKNLVLGHVESGLGGATVALKSNVQFVAHRHDGHLSASLEVNPTNAP